MNIFDYLKDVTDSAKERIKTPITGSFTISFLIYNWRPISILIFADFPITKRIQLIDDSYTSFYSLLIPIIMAVIYVVGVPYIMNYIDTWTSPAIKGRKTAKYGIKKHELEGLEEILQIEKSNNDIRSGNKDKEQLMRSISNLDDQIKKMAEKQLNTENGHLIAIESGNRTIKNTVEENKKYVNEIIILEQQNRALLQIIPDRTLEKILPDTVLKREYLDSVDFYVHKTKNAIQVQENTLQRFIELTLFIENTNNESKYQLTPLGTRLYNVLLADFKLLL